MAEFTYSFQEFSDHLASQEAVQQYQHISTQGAEAVELSDQHNFTTSSIRVMDYMRQLYPDKREVLYKGSRFCSIMNFVAEHLEELEDARLAVRGSSESILCDATWRALHQLFTAPDWLARKQDVTINEVITVARTYQERRGT